MRAPFLMGAWRVLRISWRSGRAQTIAMLGLATLPPLSLVAFGLGVRALVNGAASHDLGRALGGALACAAGAGAGLLSTQLGIGVRGRHEQRTFMTVTHDVMGWSGSIPDLALFERSDYLDQLSLFRADRALLQRSVGLVFGILPAVAQLVVVVVLLAGIHPAFLLLMPLALPALWASRRVNTMQREAEERQAERKRLLRRLAQLGTNAAAGRELRVFGLREEFRNRRHALTVELQQDATSLLLRTTLLQVGGYAIFGVAYGAAIYIAVGVVRAGHASLGDVALTLVLVGALVQQLSSMLGILAAFQSLARTEGRIDWLEQYAHRASLAPADAVDPPSALARGISLEAVSFAYGDAPAVLRNVSLHLDVGSVVALVGENGAGKTTLVKLLCALYVPNSGRISVDGIDLFRIPRAVWQQRAAACFQDYQQLELLLREAVGAGDLPRIHDVTAIEAACERGGVDFVEQLPHGFETQLGAGWRGGVELSGGQWQRVALARGFMRQSPLLLVLDEPAASLDAQAEHALFERVAIAVRSTAGQERVTILVTHRFSTVRMADVIHVLEGGRIVESGDHATLIGKGGRYAELFEMQAAGYR